MGMGPLIVGGCDDRNSHSELTGETMGTYYRVNFDARGACSFEHDQVDQALADLNRTMSTYDEASELSVLNRAGSQTWIDASPRLMIVLRNARLHYERSSGAFDVTVGPLVNLWGFGPISPGSSPSSAAQEQAADLVGMDKLELGSDRVRKLRDGLYIDLSALAKGFAVDQIADLLEAAGCVRYMVDIGGEMRLSGLNPRGLPWRIGIELPDAGQVGVSRTVLSLTDTAIATSGDYRNYHMVDGVRVDHVLDPRSGTPADNDVVSVTVVHPSAMWADAYATTVMVLGLDAGLTYADEEGFAVYILSRDQSDSAHTWRARYNAAMHPYLPESDER